MVIKSNTSTRIIWTPHTLIIEWQVPTSIYYSASQDLTQLTTAPHTVTSLVKGANGKPKYILSINTFYEKV